MLFNLTVVYFAFGAPVGVYGVIRTKGRSSREFAATLFRFLFWPLFAALSIRKAFVFEPPVESLEQEVDALRAEFESELDRASLPEFRDTFARYTGLAMAAAEDNNAAGAKELLRVAERDGHRVGSACLARRDRRKLEFHLLLARNEFLEITNTISRRELRVRLAKLIGDRDLR